MELYIKNMVCPRCIRVVREELGAIGLHPVRIELGRVVIQEDQADLEAIRDKLKENGFELLEEKTAQLVNHMKTFLIRMIREDGLATQKMKISVLLENEFGKDPNYLSQLFSQLENNTLEKYIILQKVEQIKEWIAYNELSFSEMAYKLGYSSVGHLSNQFKQVTGFSPTTFKNLKIHQRKGIDSI